MSTRESTFTTKFKKWLHSSLTEPTATAYEVKVTPHNRIPFDAVKPHQLEALFAVTDGKFLYKIPDAGWQNPFDLVVLSRQDAFVVLAFLPEKGKASVYLISPFVFLRLKEMYEQLNVKSLTEEMLQKACVDFDRCTHHLI